MPIRSSKFTDSNLKLFYGNLLNHYKECTKRFGNSDVNAVYKELFLATQYAVESPQGSLNHLERREKEKVYTAFHTIFYALPLFTRLSPDKQQRFNPPCPSYNALTNNHPQYTYQCTDPKLFNWVTLNQNLNPYLPYLKNSSSPDDSRIKIKKSKGMIVGMALISLVFSAVVLTLTAWSYLLYQFLNSTERLWYNEGSMRAVLMCAAAITSSSVTTTLTLLFAASPIITVALAASLNPITVLIVTGICLASMGAALGSLAMNCIYDAVEKRNHKKSIDSSDPYRFMLTEDDEDVLIEKNIDPVKVKCALVALRVEMNRVLNNEKAAPSFLSRHFGNQKSKQIHSLLQMVRALRSGDISEAVFGDFKFDCRVYLQPVPQREYSLLQSANCSNLYPDLFSEKSGMFNTYSAPIPPIMKEKSIVGLM
jgi:hypothetical protein